MGGKHYYWPPKKRNKYNAVRQTYNGYSYHSTAEAQFAAELDLRKKAKDIKEWQRQIRIPLYYKDQLIANYIMDFKVTHNDGSTEYIEVKGFKTAEWFLKWKLLKAILAAEQPKTKLTLVEV